MADLEEITETPRADINNDSCPEEDGDLTRRNSAKRKRSKKRRSSDGSQSSAQTSSSGCDLRPANEQSVQKRADSPKWNAMPTQDDHRARFYEDYRKVAEGHDKEFLRRHEDFSTALIFAGLFSVVTSAFIIEINSQLQPNPNDETAALLRVLIYNTNKTTFGKNVPPLPQWTGPPRTIVQVQAILFASLAVSLFSAFLAILGKQWLNRYESIDMRGPAVERSHKRQRKLDGMVVWYFDHVMDLLPLTLQAALLLLGCALSRYLWDINVIVASVVLGVTSFGVIFYLFVVIAGTASESCPYQTPGSHIFRRILYHHLLPALSSASAAVSSAFSRIYQASWCGRMFSEWWMVMRRPWYSISNVGYTLMFPVALVVAPARDAYYVGRATLRSLVVLGITGYHQLKTKLRTSCPRRIHTSRKFDSDHRTIMMDLRCISWILQTSLDRAAHLSAFKHLVLMPKLAHFRSTLVVDCFSIFIGCITVSNSRVMIMQGLEQLATASANGFFRALHHLATVDPTSGVMVELQRRYNEVFPPEIDFTGLPFYSTMTKIHALAGRFGNPHDIQWPNRKLSPQEHVPFARWLVKTAQEKYQRTRQSKVPRWILRSALYFFSLGPLSPPSVVADSLTIVAIDLDCDVSKIATSDESQRVEYVSSLIIQKLEAMVEAVNSDLIISKRKAINTLFPYAIYLEQGGQQGMANAILRAARASNFSAENTGKFMWRRVILYISRLFESGSPTSLNRVITLVSPYVPWHGALKNKIAVARWAVAASETPYTEEIGQSVVDTLFQIAYIDPLRPHIPISTWGLLKNQPSLPHMYYGIARGGSADVVAHVRGLGDIDILKSYFILLWTDLYVPDSSRTHAMKRSIREDFGGTEMKEHRADLLERLDHVLERLDQHLEYSLYDTLFREAKTHYTELKDALLEVDGQ